MPNYAFGVMFDYGGNWFEFDVVDTQQDVPHPLDRSVLVKFTVEVPLVNRQPMINAMVNAGREQWQIVAIEEHTNANYSMDKFIQTQLIKLISHDQGGVESAHVTFTLKVTYAGLVDAKVVSGYAARNFRYVAHIPSDHDRKLSDEEVEVLETFKRAKEDRRETRYDYLPWSASPFYPTMKQRHYQFDELDTSDYPKRKVAVTDEVKRHDINRGHNLVGSQHKVEFSPDGDTHTAQFDVDVPMVAYPSTSPGHHHLVFPTLEMPWGRYIEFLQMMAYFGVVSRGWVEHCIEEGQSFLRPPGAVKPPHAANSPAF
jgi:hypothetical protein